MYLYNARECLRNAINKLIPSAKKRLPPSFQEENTTSFIKKDFESSDSSQGSVSLTINKNFKNEEINMQIHYGKGSNMETHYGKGKRCGEMKKGPTQGPHTGPSFRNTGNLDIAHDDILYERSKKSKYTILYQEDIMVLMSLGLRPARAKVAALVLEKIRLMSSRQGKPFCDCYSEIFIQQCGISASTLKRALRDLVRLKLIYRSWWNTLFGKKRHLVTQENIYRYEKEVIDSGRLPQKAKQDFCDFLEDYEAQKNNTNNNFNPAQGSVKSNLNLNEKNTKTNINLNEKKDISEAKNNTKNEVKSNFNLIEKVSKKSAISIEESHGSKWPMLARVKMAHANTQIKYENKETNKQEINKETKKECLPVASFSNQELLKREVKKPVQKTDQLKPVEVEKRSQPKPVEKPKKEVKILKTKEDFLKEAKLHEAPEQTVSLLDTYFERLAKDPSVRNPTGFILKALKEKSPYLSDKLMNYRREDELKEGKPLGEMEVILTNKNKAKSVNESFKQHSDLFKVRTDDYGISFSFIMGNKTVFTNIGYREPDFDKQLEFQKKRAMKCIEYFEKNPPNIGART